MSIQRISELFDKISYIYPTFFELNKHKQYEKHLINIFLKTIFQAHKTSKVHKKNSIKK
jgi:hypothetical protein